MSSVTFLASVGGNGSTVTDDSNASTGLANGGHIIRFVPALAQIVAVAGVTVAAAATASATANVTVWISGTTYALYAAVISPANQQTYRRLVAGGGTTDPSTDTTNWASISSARADILTHAAASKTIPDNADELPIVDSAASYFLKKLTWANLKAALWASPAITGTPSFGGTDYFGAWTAYTPTVTASSGAFTTVSAAGRAKLVGKTRHFTVTVTITTAGTAAGAIWLTLPGSAAQSANYFAIGRNATNGLQLFMFLNSTTSMALVKPDGTTAIASGTTVSVSGTYEEA